MTVELLVPTHRNLLVNGHLIPVKLQGRVHSQVRDEKEVADLPHALGGRDKKPMGAVRFVAPDGHQVIIMGNGKATAAELQDLAWDAIGKAKEAVKKNGGTVFNFRAMREREGLPQPEVAREWIREGAERNLENHRKNPVSNPMPVHHRWTPEELKELDDELERCRKLGWA